jgi:formamidase
VEIETRDSFDGQIVANRTTVADLGSLSIARAHPLTGPVYVEGAEPGDLLAVKIEEVRTATTGFTAILPGFGFLRDCFTSPFLLADDGFDSDGRAGVSQDGRQLECRARQVLRRL